MMKGALRPLRGLLDVVLPPRCMACGALVSAPGLFCPDCWASLGFLDGPACVQCGLPFESPADGHAEGHNNTADGGLKCGACLADPPAFARARAVWRYDGAARATIVAFKHGDRPEQARHLAPALARAVAGLLDVADLVVVPVPLHRGRIWRRGYNQAALLARALARLVRRPVVLDALLRVRATPPQQGLDRAARRANVRRAFAVNPSRTVHVRGRTVLLVDDVMTTGATLDACATALLKAGAREVRVATLARVVLAA